MVEAAKPVESSGNMKIEQLRFDWMLEPAANTSHFSKQDVLHSTDEKCGNSLNMEVWDSLWWPVEDYYNRESSYEFVTDV